MRLKRGDVVDRYTIVELLGEGGMGEVYRAIDVRLQRSVALKVLSPPSTEPGSQPRTDGAARMLREARAAASLEHANVVHVYDVGQLPDGETTFLAMELIKGRPLRAFVGDSSVPVATRLRWLGDIARALGAAHALGIVHRDVKPENVMVRDDGVIKVLDFGIARRSRAPVSTTSSTEAQILPSITTHGVAVGTPFYMAPEQMRGETVDGRADQFSWGVVAYEVLSGKRPWTDDTDALQLVAQVLSKEVDPLRPLGGEVPSVVVDVVMRALSKDPKKRFSSMEALADALEGKRDAATSLGLADTDGRIALEPSVPPMREPAKVEASAHVTTARSAPEPGRSSPALKAGVIVALAAIAAAVLVLRARPRSEASDASAERTTGISTRECTKNAECAAKHGGAAWACNAGAGKCVAMESEDCAVFAEAGDATDERTVWLGAMFARSGPPAAEGLLNIHGAELARRDFARTLGRVGGRPIALLACDDQVDPMRAARHLIDVGAPAVIGFSSSDIALSIAGSQLLPRGALAMIATNTSPILSSLPQPDGTPRLVWRTMLDARDVAAPLAALVRDHLEPAIRRSAREGDAPIGVAVVRFRNDAGAAFTDALFRTLEFNGKSALDNGKRFREVVLDFPGASKPDYASAIGVLLEDRPDVILYRGRELLSGVVAPLEKSWPSAARRPYYASPDGFEPHLVELIGTDPSLRHRVFGVTTVSTTPTNARFVLAYNAAFPEKVTRTFNSNTAYDGFYALAYAALSVGDEAITGAALSRGIHRITPPGVAVDVGPDGIFDAYRALQAGKNIDLSGASGSLDFDPATGDAAIDQAITCADVDVRGRATDGIESGLVYDPHARKLIGSLKCP